MAGTELKDFFEGMTKSLTEAIAAAPAEKVEAPAAEAAASPDVIKTLQESITKMQGTVDVLAKALTPPSDGVEPGAVMKQIGEMAETLVTYGDVLEKALDRLEVIEKGTAVRKSIKGDDTTDTEDSEKKAVKKNVGWGNVVNTLLKDGAVTIN